uniref:Uncharacterized protein n=1 Tax=Oryza sativa subsp. japonica TaxID=39947 RepID=Q6Z997_ORYSJ|nr:hypothetical protein [Oryza sativa Japonica Group]
MELERQLALEGRQGGGTRWQRRCRCQRDRGGRRLTASAGQELGTSVARGYQGDIRADGVGPPPSPPPLPPRGAPTHRCRFNSR